jgi:hypothetical protein
VVEWSWYSAVAEAFNDPAVDFIGGPCLPAWEAAPPGWLPRKWQGVIGFVDNGANRMPFRAEGAILIGGNAVIRREVLQRVGLFSTDLGPTAERRMFSCEDEDLHARLIAAGARGHYVPALRVRHRVPPHRMTKRYYRRWSFWNGVSKSVLDAQRPLPGRRIGQIPRHLVGAAAWGVLHSLGARRDPAAAFDGQLRVVHLAGFIYGAYWYRNAER